MGINYCTSGENGALLQKKKSAVHIVTTVIRQFIFCSPYKGRITLVAL